MEVSAGAGQKGNIACGCGEPGGEFEEGRVIGAVVGEVSAAAGMEEEFVEAVAKGLGDAGDIGGVVLEGAVEAPEGVVFQAGPVAAASLQGAEDVRARVSGMPWSRGILPRGKRRMSPRRSQPVNRGKVCRISCWMAFLTRGWAWK